MKKNLLVLTLVATACFARFTANAQEKIASAPPMGWNSYNSFGSAVHEDEVKANAQYMARNLKQHGWQYVVIDFLWAYDNPPGSRIGNVYQKRLQDGSYIPWLAMDKWGRLLPQSTKFPSACGGKGFKPLATYIHQLGLKFGIHIMRGIPRQAVWAKTPVLGAKGITADMIADTTSTCDWLNHMYGLDMSKPGAQAYLNSLLGLYASWGVDFIKVDDISRPYHQPEIEGYHKAIAYCKRPIVLSISPGETPVSAAENVKLNANMWRMADDFWDNWKEVLHMFNYAKAWEGQGDPGHWPDCDMLQIGKLSKRGPVGEERYSRFTDDELYTHINFWCIYKSPLMIGCNLPENRRIERALLTNDEVLAVNQSGQSPRQLFKNDQYMIWYSKVPNSTDLYVAVFNISDNGINAPVDLSSLGLKGKISVRDLWKHQSTGTFSGTFNQQLNKHASAIFRVRMVK
ncbi:MAG TPA: glycoside hydrolase family 27 protein [Mucilaginibacter sp.]